MRFGSNPLMCWGLISRGIWRKEGQRVCIRYVFMYSGSLNCIHHPDHGHHQGLTSHLTRVSNQALFCASTALLWWAASAWGFWLFLLFPPLNEAHSTECEVWHLKWLPKFPDDKTQKCGRFFVVRALINGKQTVGGNQADMFSLVYFYMDVSETWLLQDTCHPAVKQFLNTLVSIRPVWYSENCFLWPSPNPYQAIDHLL